MKAIILCSAMLLAACDAENGEPSPPLANLVECDPAAAADSQLACPPDAGAIDADVITDASAQVDASENEDAGP